MVLKSKGDLKKSSLRSSPGTHAPFDHDGHVLVGAIPIFMFLKADFTFMLLYLGGALIRACPPR